MEQFIGLDVSQDNTHVCIINDDDKVAWQGSCPSTPEEIAATIQQRSTNPKRIGLETGPLSTWHYHALCDKGLPIVCIDARHAHAALSMQINKTDKNDALGLAKIVKAGWYKEVKVKSLSSHSIRAMLGARAQLVSMGVDTRNQIRSVFKTFGVILKPQRRQGFEMLVQNACDGEGRMVADTVTAMLTVYKGLKQQIRLIETQLIAYAKDNVACRLIMSIPGIGPLTAIAFTTAIDDPHRFAKSRAVAAYLGLTPRRYQSGEVDRNGRISKCGDPLVRAYLFEASTYLLTKAAKWSTLRAWGMRIAKRSGMKNAKVAVVRKLAVIMHRMWLTGEPFRFTEDDAALAA